MAEKKTLNPEQDRVYFYAMRDGGRYRDDILVAVNGKTFKIRAKSEKVRNNLKLPTNHASNFRYFTDNSKVAKVSSSGVITGVGKGWCRVYVQTGNGIWKIIQVTVK